MTGDEGGAAGDLHADLDADIGRRRRNRSGDLRVGEKAGDQVGPDIQCHAVAIGRLDVRRQQGYSSAAVKFSTNVDAASSVRAGGVEVAAALREGTRCEQQSTNGRETKSPHVFLHSCY